MKICIDCDSRGTDCGQGGGYWWACFHESFGDEGKCLDEYNALEYGSPDWCPLKDDNDRA